MGTGFGERKLKVIIKVLKINYSLKCVLNMDSTFGLLLTSTVTYIYCELSLRPSLLCIQTSRQKKPHFYVDLIMAVLVICSFNNNRHTDTNTLHQVCAVTMTMTDRIFANSSVLCGGHRSEAFHMYDVKEFSQQLC